MTLSHLLHRFARRARVASAPALAHATVRRAAAVTCETLEHRRLLSVSTDSIVRFDTTMGNFDVQLFQDLTPATVANFLQYVNSGRYDNTLIHRSVPGFIIQGGGYNANTLDHIPEFAPVVNEFIASNSNTRGKIAMAKLGGDPDSATSEFFFNLADNSQNLDNQNGGFTSFGIVLGDGMKIIDQMAAVPVEDRTNVGSAFGEIPLINGDTPIILTSVSEIKTITLGDTSERNVLFTAANGAQQVISLAGNGSAGITMLGDNLTVTSDGATYHVTGSNIRVDGIDTQNMANQSALAVGSLDPTKPAVSTLHLSTGPTRRAIRFQDADGTFGTVRLVGPGSLEGIFTGSNLRLVMSGNIATISGANVQMTDTTLTGVNAASVLSINAAGGADGRVIVGNITSDGAMGAILAPRVTVDSSVISIGGTLRQLRLDALNATRVEIHGTAGHGLVFNVNQVINSDLFSDRAQIVSLRTNNWIIDDGAVHGVIAPVIRQINVRGDFAASLYLDDQGTPDNDTPTAVRMNTVRILGTADGTWSIDGTVQQWNINNFQTTFDATVSGTILRIKAGAIRGNITAATIRSIDSFALSEATLTLNAPYAPGALGLSHMRLRNAMYHSMIRSTNDLGFLNVAGVYHSFICAGISDAYTNPIQQQLETARTNRLTKPPTPNTGITAPLPTADDFVSPAALRNLNLRGFFGRDSAFVNSTIAAPAIVRAGLRLTRLSQVNETEPTPFYIVSQNIRQLGLYGNETRQSVNLLNITSQAALDVSLARQNAALGDLKIRITGAQAPV